MDIIEYDVFSSVEMRSGTIIRVEAFPEARKPAYKVWVDFGPDFGVCQTSAQVTVHYTKEQLLNRQVIGVLNLGSKRIAGFKSEFLLVGFPDEAGAVCLVGAQEKVPNGAKLF
jgi:tRNA-binding protein